MFSLGVGLTPSDFLRVGQRPLAFFIGAFHQVILLPILAYVVVVLFNIQAELAVGIMIVAACPGGVTSNVVTRFAKGDVALSVSLTAVISLLSIITVPLLLTFAMSAFMGDASPAIDITATAFTMFLLTVVPITIGMGLRKLFPSAMIRAEPILSHAATALFAVIIAAALAANWALFIENLPRIGPALAVLVVLLALIGFIIPRALGRTRQEAKTISIETGIQNGTLGIAIAAIIVSGGEGFSPYAVPSAVYGIAMYLILLPTIYIYRRIN